MDKERGFSQNNGNVLEAEEAVKVMILKFMPQFQRVWRKYRLIDFIFKIRSKQVTCKQGAHQVVGVVIGSVNDVGFNFH